MPQVRKVWNKVKLGKWFIKRKNKMKKSIYVMAAALMTFASCSNEDLLNEVNIQNDVIKASFEQGVTASRLAISDGEVLTWSTGDAFMLFGEGSSAKFTLSEGAGQATATFTGTAPSTITGAAFPWESESKPSLSNGTLTMTLPATLDQTTAGACNLPMWASTTSVDEISFKHLAGVLKVNFTDIPTGYNQLVVTASNPISGEFTATTTDDEPVLSSTSTADEDKTVTVNFTAATDNANDAVLYIPLPVGTYTSIVVSVSDGTTTKELITYNEKTVARAKVYTATLNYGEIEANTPTNKVKALFANGGSLTLTEDVTLDEALTLASDKEVTLDLDGKILTINTETTRGIDNAGTLTISNGNVKYTAQNEVGSSAIYNAGVITLTNVNIESNAICFANKGAWTDGSTLQEQSDPTVIATITGGEFKSTTSGHDTNGNHVYAVTVMDNAKLIMSNATVEGDGGIDIDCAHAELSKVTATHTCNSTAGLYVTACEVTIDDECNFDSFYAYDVSNLSGNYGTTNINEVTYSGNQSLVTVSTATDLQDALTNGKNVVLTSEVTLTSLLTVPANTSATLNLGGNTLTINAEKGISNAGTLTISNGDVKHTAQNEVGSSAIYNSGNITLTNVDVESNAICFANIGSWVENKTLEEQGEPSVIATIDGGTFTSSATQHQTGTNYHVYSVTVMNNAKLIMSNATVSGDGGIDIDCAHAELESVKATHTCNSTAGLYVTACVVTYDENCDFDSVYADVYPSYGTTKVNENTYTTSGAITK